MRIQHYETEFCSVKYDTFRRDSDRLAVHSASSGLNFNSDSVSRPDRLETANCFDEFDLDFNISLPSAVLEEKQSRNHDNIISSDYAPL